MMQGGLTSILNSSDPLAQLVGDRIHWLVQPSGSKGFPYVNLQMVSEPRSYNVDGEAKNRQSRVQVDIWAETYSAALIVEAALTTLVSGYSGTVDSIEFQGIFIDSSRDLSSNRAGGDGVLFGRSIDIMISWESLDEVTF